MADLERYRLGSYARVSAEFGIDTYDEELVTVRMQRDNGWQIEMTPCQARKLARRLNKAASLLDPPKKRK